MPLAQEPTPRIVDPRSYLSCLYGESGVGKTTFGSTVDGHYFLFTEAGGSGVSVYGESVVDWPTFLAKGAELIKAKNAGWEGQREIKTVFIDTIDSLLEYAGDWICQNETFVEQGKASKFSKIDDVPWGKGYKRLAQLVLSKIQRLRLAGFGVFLIGHQKERIVKWRGQDLTRVGFNMTPSVADTFQAACDAIGYAAVEETVQKGAAGEVESVETGRYVYWQPTFLRLAKHRLRGFPARVEFKLDTAWDSYVEAFNGRVQALKGQ